MDGGLLAARIVHILASAVWIGGMVFLVAVALPFARSLDPEHRIDTISQIGRRFRPVAWTALAALVASGLYTMWRFGLLSWAMLRGSEYGRVLTMKLSLVVVLVVLAAVHDFVLGPRAQPGSRNPLLLVLARTNAVLTIVIPVIGVLLSH